MINHQLSCITLNKFSIVHGRTLFCHPSLQPGENICETVQNVHLTILEPPFGVLSSLDQGVRFSY